LSTLGQSGTQREQRSLAVQSVAAQRRRQLRILFFHRDEASVERCLQELRSAQFTVRAVVVSSPDQFAERLRAQPFDLIVAEHPSDNGQALQPLELLPQGQKHTPLIFVAEKMRRETAAELITKGAADCIEMDHIGHLPVAVRRALNENHLREERDRAEKQLRHSEAHYRALVGNLTYGMCRCSLDGQFLDANQALLTMLGYASREELLEVNLASEIVCDPAKRAQVLGDFGQENGTEPMEVDWKRRDGTNLKVRLSGREVSSEEGGREGYEIIVEDVTKQRELEDHLRQQAAKDPLTGLANYRHLVDVLDSEIKRSKRTGREFALLLFDLDHLKQINDRYGHLTGSEALCRLADALCIGGRDIDTAARFGGDEFALVLPETGEKSARVVAKRICENVANDGKEPKISVSVGVAIYPGNAERIDSLLSSADVEMYLMKNKGRILPSNGNGL